MSLILKHAYAHWTSIETYRNTLIKGLIIVCIKVNLRKTVDRGKDIQKGMVTLEFDSQGSFFAYG